MEIPAQPQQQPQDAAAVGSVTVRCVPGDADMTILVSFGGTSKTMLRSQTEAVGKVLGRLRLVFEPKKAGGGGGKGGGNKKKGPPQPDPSPAATPAAEPATATPAAEPPAAFVLALLGANGVVIDEATPNAEAWPMATALRVGDTLGLICVNPPAVASLQLGKPLLAEFPVLPEARLEFAEERRCLWRWQRVNPDGSPGPVVGDAKLYTPDRADIGCSLTVACTPVDAEGRTGAVVSAKAGPVVAGPGVGEGQGEGWILLSRMRRQVAEGSFRVVTYNLLADRYCDSEWAREHLYPHCPPDCVPIDYRKQLIARELALYGADVVALQEVDKVVFEEYYRPYLAEFGLVGIYGNKSSQQPIGNAFLYRERYFRFVATHVVDLTTAWRLHPLLASVCEAFPPVQLAMEQCTTIAQLLLLEAPDGRRICFSNNHLYGHPSAPHIRILQVALQLYEIERLYGKDVTVVLCGDLNCEANSGAVELAVLGRIDSSHPDWVAGAGFVAPSTKDEREAQWFKGFKTDANECATPALDLEQPFSLQSACGHLEFSYFARPPGALLDHILIGTALGVEYCFPMFKAEQLLPGIPSKHFPSDHVAVVADLFLKI